MIARLAFLVCIHAEDRRVGIPHVLHVHEHGVLDFGALVPVLILRGQIETEPEGSPPARVDIIGCRLDAVGGHADRAQRGHP